MTDQETLITLAKWAESAERYDDMADYMKKVVSLPLLSLR